MGENSLRAMWYLLPSYILYWASVFSFSLILNFYISFEFLESVIKLFGGSSHLLFCREQIEQYFSLITDLDFIVLIIMWTADPCG